MGRVLVVLLCGALVGLVWAPDARAQGVGVRYSRPADTGASARVGQVGGQYTHRPVSPSVAGRPQRGPNVNPIMSFGDTSAPRRGGYFGDRRPAAQRLGMIPSPNYRSLFRKGALSDARIGASSGYLASISATMPLYGRGLPNALRVPEVPLFDVEPGKSPFHRVFNLEPSQTAAEKPARVSFESLMDAVEENTHRNTERLRERAYRLFREATGGKKADGEPLTPQEKPPRLRSAADLFTNVGNLSLYDEQINSQASEDLEESERNGRDIYLPHLLSAHAYLECCIDTGQQTDSALRSLIGVARVYPEAFAELAAARREPETYPDRPNLAACFGDFQGGHSPTLDRQMRLYLRTASVATPTLNSLVLQAYCAWVLDDATRARQVLDLAEAQLESAVLSPQGFEEWRNLIAALRYAL